MLLIDRSYKCSDDSKPIRASSVLQRGKRKDRMHAKKGPTAGL